MTDEVETPLQSEEARKAILAKSSAGQTTAIGQARQDLINEGEDRPEPPGGSKLPIVGGEPRPDAAGPVAPVGAQAQPAIITTNGTLPVNHVPSPSGPVPVSSLTHDPVEGARLVKDALDSSEKQLLRSGAEKLSRAKIESMNAADLRAVASDRGYQLGDYAGSRVTRQRFIAAQNKDAAVNDDNPET